MPIVVPPPAREIPAQPGCYLFSDAGGAIIYIGKARNLRRRVGSYFQRQDHDPKTRALIEKITHVEFILTDTEVEALILENTLIKKYGPRYNINLKDAKQYAFIRLTDDPFPRLLIARRRDEGGKYFGPFTSAQQRDEIIQRIVRIFRIRTCKKMPKKPCLRYQIHLCTAPCAGLVDASAYRSQVTEAVRVLRGRTASLIAALQEEMAAAAEALRFESAIELRNRIRALERLQERQNMNRTSDHDEDIIHYRVQEGRVYLMLFGVQRGVLSDRQEFLFDLPDRPLEEFLARYYGEHPVPREVVVPEAVSPAVRQYLNRDHRVRITVPQRGEKKELLDLVARNIEATFFRGDRQVADLQEALQIQDRPATIECFDISHLSGTLTVGAMVRFREGSPEKSNYRRFRIRTVEKIDDFAAIAEIVGRRYRRLIEEEDALPDLVMIDGGAGQLSAALEALHDLGLHLPVIALAKKLEEIYLPGGGPPLRLEAKRPALLLLQRIRDEAHRFAITYHRLLRRQPFKPKQ